MYQRVKLEEEKNFLLKWQYLPSGALVHWDPSSHPGCPLDYKVHLCLPHLPPHGKHTQQLVLVYTNTSNIYPVIMSDNRLQFQINLSLLKRDHIVQVLAMVGFRKAMDYCPSLFSQRDLFYLDRLAIFNSCWNFGNWLKLKKILDCSLMPEKRKKNKSKRTGAGSNEVGWKLRIWKLMFVLQMYPDKGNLLYSR